MSVNKIFKLANYFYNKYSLESLAQENQALSEQDRLDALNQAKEQKERNKKRELFKKIRENLEPWGGASSQQYKEFINQDRSMEQIIEFEAQTRLAKSKAGPTDSSVVITSKFKDIYEKLSPIPESPGKAVLQKKYTNLLKNYKNKKSIDTSLLDNLLQDVKEVRSKMTESALKSFDKEQQFATTLSDIKNILDRLPRSERNKLEWRYNELLGIYNYNKSKGTGIPDERLASLEKLFEDTKRINQSVQGGGVRPSRTPKSQIAQSNIPNTPSA